MDLSLNLFNLRHNQMKLKFLIIVAEYRLMLLNLEKGIVRFKRLNKC